MHAICSGPENEMFCHTENLLTSKLLSLKVSYGCHNTALLPQELTPTMLRTSSTFLEIARFIGHLLRFFHWQNHVVFITMDPSFNVWRELIDELRVSLLLNKMDYWYI